ncbi:hypothetical protein LTR78_010800 [Recurvomyces mirabilis]|uniref:F-box domain-containing protein n=1 Tax=Recurvomyces mirabilis TaxID=574656 RepID=A0AAE0WI35_9PEZI|nr:hypothetical protein LTR78_010800 [Recurvomyces mirabilis]KAK5149502.1 hypothetical protein LTS14_010868 [Recurvomyces mirabilis]
MSPALEDCPPEIIENICRVLDLEAVCHLRQTCRELACKATQDHFESFLQCKEVFITPDGLQRFAKATQSGLISSRLQRLKLTGIVNNTLRLAATTRDEGLESDVRKDAERHLDVLTQRQEEFEEMHSAGLDILTLAEAFRNLATCSVRSGTLLSISLNIVAYRTDSKQRLQPSAQGSWKMIWERTASTYWTCMRALLQSGLQISALDVFTKQERCSLACNEMSAMIPTDGMPSLSTLKSLSISLSDRLIEESHREAERTGDSADEIDWEVDDKGGRPHSELAKEAADESNYSGLIHLLISCPALEDLDLHQYSLKTRVPVSLHKERYLQRIAEQAPLSKLKSLTLRGFTARADDLLVLVRRPALRVLKLERLLLVAGSGNFQPIFKYCTGANSCYDELHFEDLYEGHVLVLFASIASGGLENATLRRSGVQEVRRPIVYQAREEEIVGSPGVYEHQAKVRRIYGPPR